MHILIATYQSRSGPFSHVKPIHNQYGKQEKHGYTHSQWRAKNICNR